MDKSECTLCYTYYGYKVRECVDMEFCQAHEVPMATDNKEEWMARVNKVEKEVKDGSLEPITEQVTKDGEGFRK